MQGLEKELSEVYRQAVKTHRPGDMVDLQRRVRKLMYEECEREKLGCSPFWQVQTTVAFTWHIATAAAGMARNTVRNSLVVFYLRLAHRSLRMMLQNDVGGPGRRRCSG